MNKWLRTALKHVITALTIWYKQLEKQSLQETDSQPFSALTPIDTVSNVNYDQALRWALDQRKEKLVYNVALTGPYGSGKSSVIRTFERNNRFQGYHFLNISLATFKEGESATTQAEGKEKQVTVNQIEASILQQLFYKEEDKNIPESRFKKINRPYKRKRFAAVAGVFLWLIALTFLFFKDSFTKIFGLQTIPKWITDWALMSKVFPSGIFIVGVLYLIYLFVRLVGRIKLSKIKVFDSEIELDTTISKSILNQHIEEIIYFFEVTPYNVVVIEDLDRFNQPEIFTKLREINALLNSSKKIERKIVFLYAVRDDMFKDKDRAKFFDFIIPVIPVINYSNSSEMLRKLAHAHNYRWSEAIIDDVALFIDDMRLLHNITNEYHIYARSQNASLDQNKLLALLVYKNMFPNDFVALSEGRGILYEKFEQKFSLIKSKVDRVDAQIDVINEEIAQLSEVELKNESELKSLYILKFIELHPGFNCFRYNNEDLTPSTIIESKFSLFINNKLQYLITVPGYYDLQVRNPSHKFSAIEEQVDSEHTYQQRIKVLEGRVNHKTNTLKAQKDNLETEKRSYSNLPLKELIAEHTSISQTGDSKQHSLLMVLLRSGYIDESYLDYISIFYEGSLSKNDHDFVIAVKSGIVQTSHKQLLNFKKIIQKLQVNQFAQAACLHPSLLRFLLENEGEFKDQLTAMLTKLADESTVSIKFLKQHINLQVDGSLWVPKLVDVWKNAWNYVSNSNEFTNEFIQLFFKQIVEYSPTDNISQLTNLDSFVQYAGDMPEFLEIIPDHEKIKHVIQRLNIVFKTLLPAFCPDDLLDVVYQGNYYQINNFMIKLILDKKGKFDQLAFETRNYSAIHESGLDHLIEYVESNIEVYAKEILSNENLVEEKEPYILKLLNNNLTIASKKEIVQKISTQLSDLSLLLQDIDLISEITQFCKYKLIWKNLCYIYEIHDAEIKDEFWDSLSVMIGISELPEITSEEAALISSFDSFVDSLLKSNRLSDEDYKKVCEVIPNTCNFSEEELTKLNAEKIQHLCNTGVFEFTEGNLYLIYKVNGNLFLDFLHKNILTALEDEKIFNLSVGRIQTVLDSTIFTETEKVSLLNKSDFALYADYPILVSALSVFIRKVHDSIVSSPIVEISLKEPSVSLDVKLSIYMRYYNKLTDFTLTQFIEALGPNYRPILEGQKITIPDNKNYLWLAKKLKYNGIIKSHNFVKGGINLHPVN